MRKGLTESEELEIDQLLDDDIQERVKNLDLLRAAVNRHAHRLVDDWGGILFKANDEFSYDLGRHDGLEFALKLLEDANELIPMDEELLH